MQFSVRVPATSANIGPGFDCLGIAWDIYAQFDFHTRGMGSLCALKRYPSARAAGHAMNRHNLALDAYWLYAQRMHVALPDMGAYIVSDIPSTRGLGSSATCIVAGTMAAKTVALQLAEDRQRGKFSNASVFRIATQVEGHPDNIAPALYGGLQLTSQEKGQIQTTELPVSGELRFHLFIPDFSTNTRKSRSVLPKTVDREDAVFNLAALGFLMQGLRTGSGRLLRLGLQDRLHEPFRRPKISGVAQMSRLAREAGAFGTVLSGSGSSLLVVSHRQKAERVGERLRAQCPPGWEVREVHMDHRGAVLLNLEETLR